MADKNYQPLDILKQDLSRMFPNASDRMIMGAMLRNNGHRERCIEDLSLSCAGHCNVSSDTHADRYVFGGRSQSVSGATGDIRRPEMHGQRGGAIPQSAPIISGHDSPFSEIKLSFKNSSSGGEPMASYTSKFTHPTKPPVPPPTYRSSHQHEFQAGNQQYPYMNNFLPSEQNVRHKTSLIISPIRSPQMHMRNTPMNGRTAVVDGSPSSSSSSSVVRINTWGTTGMNEPKTPSGSHACQSQLHISISPDGCFASSRSESHTPPITITNTNALQPGQYVRQAASPLSSPRAAAASKVSNDGFQLSLVDIDDPEQKRITHIPLKPATSPLPNYVEKVHRLNWPVQLSGEDEVSNEAYTKALIVHQKQKLNLVEREAERIGRQREDEMRELMLLEMQYFRSHQNPKESQIFTFQELQNLRAEVRSLMVGCQNISRLVDLLNDRKVPQEIEKDFYDDLNPGQLGPAVPVQPLKDSRPPMYYPRRPQPLPVSPLDILRPEDGMTAAPSPVGRPVLEEDNDPKWECCTCTFLNPSSCGMCEMCEMPKFVQAPV